MALKITEFFGFEPLHPGSLNYVREKLCPFIAKPCIKPKHGSCSLQMPEGPPVIACPQRMYAENYKILVELAQELFGKDIELLSLEQANAKRRAGHLSGNEAVMFGKHWQGELPLPKPKSKGALKTGSYYLDWIIAKLDASGKVQEFTAVEVQTIDTTGNYKEQSDAFFKGEEFKNKNGRGFSDAGFNWENVNKRIISQLIYKGHVLGREERCTKGLFFLCPDQVYEKIMERHGGALSKYPIRNGTITFRAYDLGTVSVETGQRPIKYTRQMTTSVEQVVAAFSSALNFPEQNVYENAINKVLSKPL